MTYGGIVMPMRVIRQDRRAAVESPSRLRPFRLFGPTCDSADKMAGPFLLDDAVGEGDWIEIGQAGAYTNVLATGFNGFRSNRSGGVRDDAFLPVPLRLGDPVPSRAAE